MFRRAQRVRRSGIHRYSGNADDICRQIIDACWNQRYFQTSAGHFSGFYIRDFAFAVPGLMKLGHKKKVHKTLQFALSVYSKHRKLSTTITPEGTPLDVFDYGIDSLPLLIYSLRKAKANELIEVYRPFLEEQISFVFNNIFDVQGCCLKHGDYSGIRDNVKQKNSCYANCMLAMLRMELEKTDLFNPFREFDIKSRLKELFWNNEYFNDDIDSRQITGDANTFPFWCGVFDDKKMFTKSLASLQKELLDRPLPLKYCKNNYTRVIFPLNLLLPDYETNMIWLHLGLCFLETVKRYDKRTFATYLDAYTRLIEKEQNFPEILNPDGSLYIRTLYSSDESMIWAAKYLELC